jgi:type II restriction enzyme
MIERLKASSNPNLFLLHYCPISLSVINLIVVPKYFFVPEIIVERPPLSALARRSGWIGCNISLQTIPISGRIALIRNSMVEPKQAVLDNWHRTLFLRDQKDVRSKGWLLSVMSCIEKIGQSTFKIEEVYRYEDDLKAMYPLNRHIKEKIRQKLQILRDKGFLEFLGNGTYRLVIGKPK